MPGITNRWMKRVWEIVLNQTYIGGGYPANFYLMLVTNATPPGLLTNVGGDLTEIGLGNGYDVAGGISLTPNTTDFPNLFEDDTLNRGSIKIRDIAVNATGGDIPASGDPIRHVVLTAGADGPPTVPQREVLAWWEMNQSLIILNGQGFTFSGLTILGKAS